MKRLAIFAEGYTEVLFIKKLLEEIAGKQNVAIEHIEIRGGSKVPRKTIVVTAAKTDSSQEYFVLIVDCGGDNLVKSRILEEHQNLTTKGYSKIIGVRDVRPKFTYGEIPDLERGLKTYVKTSLAPVVFILAIMEIEAWFLSETTHFERIDPLITLNSIRTNLGFDPENDDIEQRAHPKDDLIKCYNLVGKEYTTARAHITVDALDYAQIYTDLRNRIDYLDRLINEIDTFLG